MQEHASLGETYMASYAVESYNSNTNTYSRHEVGSQHDMTKLLTSLVQDDISSKNFENYYRVNEITDADLHIWNRQKEELPDVPNTEKVFGEWTQITCASKYLNVTFGRVFNLITAGEIRAQTTTGRNKLVSVSDVVERRINKPKTGRPKGSIKKQQAEE